MRRQAGNAKLRQVESHGAANLLRSMTTGSGGAKQRAGALASPALFAHAACGKNRVAASG